MSVSPRSPLWMDDDKQNLGNSPGEDGRGRLHTKISNTALEPIPVTGSIDVDVPVPLPVEVINTSPIDVSVSNFPATQNVEVVNTTPIQVEVVDLLPEPLKISGTINGQPGGTEYTLVNNIRQQILASHDRIADFTYADFGTKNQRITQIDYSSSTIGTGPGFTARMTLTYTLVGTRYRRDSIYWTLV